MYIKPVEISAGRCCLQHHYIHWLKVFYPDEQREYRLKHAHCGFCPQLLILLTSAWYVLTSFRDLWCHSVTFALNRVPKHPGYYTHHTLLLLWTQTWSLIWVPSFITVETRSATYISRVFLSFKPDCTSRGLYSHYHVPPSPARIKLSAQVIQRLTATRQVTCYTSGYARQEHDQRRGKLIISSYHEQQELNGQNCLLASPVHNLSYVLT